MDLTKNKQLKFKYSTIILLLHCFIITLLAISCESTYTPKRPAYFRIDFPTERKMANYTCDECPFSFEYPTYGSIQKDSSDLDEMTNHPCWFNIIFPDYKAKIYLSYTAIDASNPLEKLIKDSYKLTFKHTVKADYIDETPITGKHPNVSGILYDVGGNAASGVQFYVTDKKRNFLRGSLYFYAAPNADSIAPSVQYFRKDVEHIIESLQWK
ncbi:MAG: gliding motility lipoprotein GldD [Chitinophagales bacterium]|nr:gliding motility lipoprotein GldD [Saprospirales bacterium]MBP6659312.1 gliding motility lipoprotein GldD [Chitinophagales bacterium]